MQLTNKTYNLLSYRSQLWVEPTCVPSAVCILLSVHVFDAAQNSKLLQLQFPNVWHWSAQSEADVNPVNTASLWAWTTFPGIFWYLPAKIKEVHVHVYNNVKLLNSYPFTVHTGTILIIINRITFVSRKYMYMYICVIYVFYMYALYVTYFCI